MKKNEPSPQKRFAFGKNWLNFINGLTEANIYEAEESLKKFLGISDLTNLRFLDIGSGSGILSLAARRLGAKVHSFDYDQESVECTQKIKRIHFPGDSDWIIEQGSILDKEYISSLGPFDISYAWGVLHHTGVLWQALYNAQIPLRPGGLLFIGIYNDQGIISSIWKIIKRIYCSGPIGSTLMTLIFFPIFFLSGLLIDLFHFRNPIKRYHDHIKYRGMSLLTDWRDWLGGYPFEPAEPDRVISFYQNLDFKLLKFEKTKHGFGNNQFVFQKIG